MCDTTFEDVLVNSLQRIENQEVSMLSLLLILDCFLDCHRFPRNGLYHGNLTEGGFVIGFPHISGFTLHPRS